MKILFKLASVLFLEDIFFIFIYFITADSDATEETDFKSYMQLMDQELEKVRVTEKEVSNIDEVCNLNFAVFYSHSYFIDNHNNLMYR